MSWKNWKSKKTLRIESVTYHSLWKAAESQLQRTETRLSVAEQMAMPAIWVFALNQRTAVDYLHRMDIPHNHPRVRIVVGMRPHALRGARILRGDKVIIDRRVGSDSVLMEEFDHTLTRGGVRRDDLWITYR